MTLKIYAIGLVLSLMLMVTGGTLLRGKIEVTQNWDGSYPPGSKRKGKTSAKIIPCVIGNVEKSWKWQLMTGWTPGGPPQQLVASGEIVMTVSCCEWFAGKWRKGVTGDFDMHVPDLHKHGRYYLHIYRPFWRTEHNRWEEKPVATGYSRIVESYYWRKAGIDRGTCGTEDRVGYWISDNTAIEQWYGGVNILTNQPLVTYGAPRKYNEASGLQCFVSNPLLSC